MNSRAIWYIVAIIVIILLVWFAVAQREPASPINGTTTIPGGGVIGTTTLPGTGTTSTTTPRVPTSSPAALNL